MNEKSSAAQLAEFIAKYAPDIAALTESVLAKMRARLPGAIELVYDNYNALAIAFGPTERTSDAIFSIAVYPRWVSLFFVQGATLPDPEDVLRGGGASMRHIVLEDAAALDAPAVRALMARALERARTPVDKAQPSRIVIKSVSAKQRPRRPVPARPAPAVRPRVTKKEK